MNRTTFSRSFDSIHRGASVVAIFTLLSQILGLFRDRFFSEIIGSGPVLDMYYASFRIPDLLFIILGSLISVSVLVPVFTSYKNKSEAELIKYSSQIWTFYLIISIIITICAYIMMPFLVKMLFSGHSTLFLSEVTSLSRVMLLSPFLLGISSIFTALLYVRRTFIISSLQPLFYNISIIIGVLFLFPIYGIKGLVIGVIIGACLHMSVPFLISHKPFNLKLMKFSTKEITNTVIAQSLPRTFSLSLSQVLMTLILGITGAVSSGAITHINWTYNIFSVPLSIIGVSYSLSAFTHLSHLFSQGKQEQFMYELKKVVRWIIFLSVPISLLCMAFSEQVAYILLGSHNNIDEKVGLLLSIIIISLPTASVSQVVIRAFYAQGNTLFVFISQLFGFIAGMTFLVISPHSELYAILSLTIALLTSDIILYAFFVFLHSLHMRSIVSFSIKIVIVWVLSTSVGFWVYVLAQILSYSRERFFESVAGFIGITCALALGTVLLHYIKIDEVKRGKKIIYNLFSKYLHKIT